MMDSENKVNPSFDKSTFLVCDDIRQESGGKSSLLGLLGSCDTVIELDQTGNDGDKQLALPSLAFFLGFNDGHGKFKANVTLIDPAGNNMIPDDEKEVEKQKNRPMNFIFKLIPFPAIAGAYELHVFLDDNEYKYAFTIAQKKAA